MTAPVRRLARFKPVWSLRRVCNDITAVIFGMLLVVGPVAASAQPVHTLTIAEYRPHVGPHEPTMQAMMRFAETVSRASDGRVRIVVAQDTVPGSPDAQLDAVRAGAAAAPDLMLFVTPALRHVVPEFEMLDLPFIVRDDRQADRLLDGPFGSALLSKLEPYGLTGLAWWENGFRQITTSGARFVRATDLRRRPVRVIPEPAFVATFDALGAKVAGIRYEQLYDALKTGKVDAEDNFYSQILAGRLYDVQSSLSVTNHSYSAIAVVANSAALSRLSLRDRQVVRQAAVEAGRYERDLVRARAHADRAALAGHGMTVVDVSPEQIEKMEAMTEPVRNTFLRTYDPAIVALYRREVSQASISP